MSSYVCHQQHSLPPQKRKQFGAPNVIKIQSHLQKTWLHNAQLTRKQFPLRLAYAMTYNKSQSQTLFKLLVDATTEPFAHGHLYVAASRVRDSRNIRLMVTPEQLIEREGTTPMPFVTNIVYRDIIDAMH